MFRMRRKHILLRLCKRHILHGYEILVPPVALDYDHWTRAQAETYMQWYADHVQERAAYVSKIAFGKPVQGKIAPESLLDLWKWFYKTAEIEKVPEEIIRQEREMYAQFGESFVSKIQFTVRTEYILRDIAMYMSAVFLTNHPTLYWDIVTKPKRDVFYNKPVLRGFLNMRYGKPFKSVFQPDHMIQVQACKCLDSSGTTQDLWNLYALWKQDVPEQNLEGEQDVQ